MKQLSFTEQVEELNKQVKVLFFELVKPLRLEKIAEWLEKRFS